MRVGVFNLKREQGRGVMDQRHESSPLVLADPLRSHELSRLILKLRWIGLEDEARCLQTVASALPPDDRGSVSSGPFSTD